MATSNPADAAAAGQETPLFKLMARLPDILSRAGHSEMWGVELAASQPSSTSQATPSDAPASEEAVPTESAAAQAGSGDAPTRVVLHKFLRANNDDVAAADKQLTSALEWRKANDPTALVRQQFDSQRFGGLGYVTTHRDEAAGRDVVVTWNIYGAVKDNKATFGNVQDFIKWRTALMELGVQKLAINAAKEPVAAGSEAPYRMIQVHDYRSVSFLRMDPSIKAASRETIQTMSMAYPELLSHKYFVNVPMIMGWVFGAMKLFLAPATLAKFHPMASGTSLAAELPSIVANLPSEYGGKGPSVTEGQTVLLTDAGGADADAAAAAATTKAPAGSAPEQKGEPVAEVPATQTEAEPKVEPEAKPEVNPEVKPEEAQSTIQAQQEPKTTQ